MSDFLRNVWYVAAWSHELQPGTLLARTIVGEPLVLWRTAEGRVAALKDRCVHRHAPLSRGRLEGDALRCGYHGLKFASDGRCIEVPGMDSVPAAACARSYAVIEHRRWVMVWMGDPACADTNLLPDNFSCDSTDWAYRPGYVHYETPIELIADNLLDFSHLSYVHAATFGGGDDAIARIRPQIERLPNGVRVRRDVPGVPQPAGMSAEEAERQGTGVRFHSCQALTPETAASTHYFFMEAHRADRGDAGVTEALYQGIVAAFEEDRATIAAQWRNVQHAPERPMLPLHMDAALTHYRRRYATALQSETPT